MVARQGLALAAGEVGRGLADDVILAAAGGGDLGLAEHLEAMLAPQAEEGAQGHDAEVGIVAVDDGLGGLAGGRVLADRGGPAVHFARSGNQLVDVGLGLRRRTNALLLDDQDVDRAVTRVRRTGGEGEARESGGEAEGTMVA